MQRWRTQLCPGDKIEVAVEGVGIVYTVEADVDTDGSIYVRVCDELNGICVDENNIPTD